MTAVHTCTLVEPSAMNSAASRQVEMPPMPEIGTVMRGSRASAADHVQRDRLHRRAAVAAVGRAPADAG